MNALLAAVAPVTETERTLVFLGQSPLWLEIGVWLLGALVVVFKALRDVGGRLCLADVQPAVRSVLTVTSVDRAIEVYDSVPAAEADVRPTEARGR